MKEEMKDIDDPRKDRETGKMRGDLMVTTDIKAIAMKDLNAEIINSTNVIKNHNLTKDEKFNQISAK